LRFHPEELDQTTQLYSGLLVVTAETGAKIIAKLRKEIILGNRYKEGCTIKSIYCYQFICYKL